MLNNHSDINMFEHTARDNNTHVLYIGLDETKYAVWHPMKGHNVLFYFGWKQLTCSSCLINKQLRLQ